MPDEIFWQLRFEPAKWTAERYLLPVYERMKKRQLEAHVNQSDETPVEVIHDGRPAGNKSYMWVHITGELSPVPPIIVYEYQKTRHSDHPKEYYKDYSGVLVTDGLEQYHKLERDLEGVKNANCMAHARRHFANAVKAIGKSNPEAIQASVAYQALVRIGAIYDLEGGLKNLSVQERLKERQVSIKPLVEEFFDWVRKIQTDQTVLPKGETARANGLNVYYYIKHLLTELLNGIRTDGSIDEKELEQLMPWSKNLPPECYSKRRK